MFKEYAQYDATGLAALVATGEVTAPELLEAAWDAIDAGEPVLNAISQNARAKAVAQLEKPLTGPFAGVPFLLKDLDVSYAGVKLTSGCLAARDYVPDFTSTLVQRFLDAGLVITGSTTTPELGLKATTETSLHGATRNPWDTGRTPGGSSGGAAAAVAARYVPMAHAADGGGSIRIPASYCGLFGMKPSRGRLPNGPDGGELWEGCVTSGVLTRSVRDCATMLDACAGPAPGDPFEIPPPARRYAAEVGAPVERLRIGFSTASPIGGQVDPENVAAVQAAAKLLETLGHHVEEVPPPVDGKALARCYFTMYYGHVAAAVAHVRAITGATAAAFHPDTRTLNLLGHALSAGDYVLAHKSWNSFARAMGEFHATHEIYLTPTTAMGPAKIGELETPPRDQAMAKLMVALSAGKLLLKSGLAERVGFESLQRTPFTQLANMTFCPAMSVPLHWTTENLPVGTQFSAKIGNESLLFRLAAQLESAAPWRGRVPLFK